MSKLVREKIVDFAKECSRLTKDSSMKATDQTRPNREVSLFGLTRPFVKKPQNRWTDRKQDGEQHRHEGPVMVVRIDQRSRVAYLYQEIKDQAFP